MEDYIVFLKAYRNTSRFKILSRVFSENLLEKIFLWILWITVLVMSLVSIVYINKELIIYTMIPALLGALLYRKELYSTYSDILSDGVILIFAKEYSLNYQGLRYFLVKKEIGDLSLFNIDNVRDYLSVKSESKSKVSLKNNWLIAGLMTLLAVVSNQLITGLSENFLWLVLFALVVLILFSVMLVQIFVSGDERDKEMSLFLSWLEKDIE